MVVNELRIGNLVSDIYDSDGGNGWRVKSILKDRVNVGIYIYKQKELRPILLTEEWLLEFGFEHQHLGYWSKNSIELAFITSDENYQIKIKMPYSKWLIIEIHYVHQLQNLYFALTGKEII